MGESIQRPRQNESPMHQSPGPAFSTQSLQNSHSGPHPTVTAHHHGHHQHAFMGTSSQRFRPPPINTTGVSTRAVGSTAGTAGYSSYYPAAGPAFSAATSQSSMSYPTAYSEERQTPGYSNYNAASMMYGVHPAASQSPVYHSALFSPRQPGTASTGPIMSPNDSTYSTFDSSQVVPGGGTTSLHTPSQSSSTPVTIYQPPAHTQNYHDSLEVQQPAQQHHQQQHSNVVLQEPAVVEKVEMAQRWADTLSKLPPIFRIIQSGRLKQASEALVHLTDWIMNHIEYLGLNVDSAQRAEQLRFWSDLNHAWLGLLQSQKDLVEAGQLTQQSLTRTDLGFMGKELVRMCDLIERDGLVDYEYGIWEERIIGILTESLDMMEADEKGISRAMSGTLRSAQQP